MPLILLGLLRHFNQRFGRRIVLLSQGPDDALLEDFQECCEHVLTNMDFAEQTYPEDLARFLIRLRKLASPTALVNSVVPHKLGISCRNAGFSIMALVHEYPPVTDPDCIRKYFAACETLVFPCKDVQEKCLAMSGLHTAAHPVPSWSVIPQGCYLMEKPPLDASSYERTAREFHALHGLNEETRLIMCCGTVDIRKGFDWLVALIHEFALHSPHASNTRFVWIGRVTEVYPFSMGIHDLEVAGIADRLIHIPECPDIRPYLAMADAFLLCSRIDPFPSVVLEAFYMGIPVICFDQYQGCRDLVRDTGLGRVIPYQCITAAVKALNEVPGDAALARRVVEEGPVLVAQQFKNCDYSDAIHALWHRGYAASASPGNGRHEVCMV